MTEGIVQIALVLWLGFASLIAAIVAIGHRLGGGRLDGLAPDLRAGVLRGLLVAPIAGGALLTFLCFAPKLIGIVVDSLDHCATHGDEHLHFCFRHAPETVFGGWFWAGMSVLVAMTAVLLLRRSGELRASWQDARALERAALPHATRDVWVLPSDEPVAFSVGFGARRTLVSTGLVRSLSASALDVVLAHESAHRARRDGAWNVLVHLAGWAHLPATARSLHRDLATACEQACDDRAAEAIGDRFAVATALLAVARMRTATPRASTALLAFGAGQLESRVRALVDDVPRRRLPRGGEALMIALSITLAVLVADPLHHTLETLFHVLIG